MLGLFAKVTVKPDLVERFWKHLLLDVEGSRAEPGCLRFDVLRDEKAANVFYLYEVYRDHAAYGRHQEAPYFKAFFAEAGDTLAAPPEIHTAEVVSPADGPYWARLG
ncbi:MAG TPA: putative quinol monooxygenase [Polyangiaceae bacterium]|jgi:quinol monooxygenase YgiN